MFYSPFYAFVGDYKQQRYKARKTNEERTEKENNGKSRHETD
jgi:hypothetical protein